VKKAVPCISSETQRRGIINTRKKIGKEEKLYQIIKTISWASNLKNRVLSGNLLSI
jgi:hypothetical protein